MPKLCLDQLGRSIKYHLSINYREEMALILPRGILLSAFWLKVMEKAVLS